MQTWQEVTPEFVRYEGTLEIYEAKGSFETGKAFFRLKIAEK